MRGQNLMRILDKVLPRIAVQQKLDDRSFERISVAHLDRAVFRYKSFSKHGEVFHVRAKHNRFAGQNRFHWVLSTLRSEAFPNENNSSNIVPSLKVAGRIEYQAIRVVAFAAGASITGDSYVISYRLK